MSMASLCINPASHYIVVELTSFLRPSFIWVSGLRWIDLNLILHKLVIELFHSNLPQSKPI
jgi:hypothetical protein